MCAIAWRSCLCSSSVRAPGIRRSGPRLSPHPAASSGSLTRSLSPPVVPGRACRRFGASPFPPCASIPFKPVESRLLHSGASLWNRRTSRSMPQVTRRVSPPSPFSCRRTKNSTGREGRSVFPTLWCRWRSTSSAGGGWSPSTIARAPLEQSGSASGLRIGSQWSNQRLPQSGPDASPQNRTTYPGKGRRR